MTRGRGGFTIIEVMVCAAILAIGIMGLLSVTVGAQQVDAMTRRRAMAARLLNAVSEHYRSIGPTNIVSKLSQDLGGVAFQIGEFKCTPAANKGIGDFEVTGLRIDYNGDGDYADPEDVEFDANGDPLPLEIKGATVKAHVLTEQEAQSDPNGDGLLIPGDWDGTGGGNPCFDTTTDTVDDGTNMASYIVYTLKIEVEYSTGVFKSDANGNYVDDLKQTITSFTVLYPSVAN